jgi:hypothetical protein
MHSNSFSTTQPKQVSTSFITNNTFYRYGLMIGTNNKLYSYGYFNAGITDLGGNTYHGISNFILVDNKNYVVDAPYSNTTESYSIRIYEVTESTNKITLTNLITSYSDDYGTYRYINGIHLSTIYSSSLSTDYFLAATDTSGISYFCGAYTFRFDSSMTNGNSFLNCTGTYDEGLDQQVIYAANGSYYYYKISEIVCFLQETKITILENDEEIERNVEHLKIGDFVKIGPETYKKINFIGYQNIDISDNIKYITVLQKDAIAENLPYENLYLTTGHSLLFTDLKYANKYYNKNSYNNNIEGYYKIMSQHCSLCNTVQKPEIEKYIHNDKYVKVYNFSLDSEDPSSQYAVYSNGIRSECMSHEYAIKKSNMTSL